MVKEIRKCTGSINIEYLSKNAIKVECNKTNLRGCNTFCRRKGHFTRSFN